MHVLPHKHKSKDCCCCCGASLLLDLYPGAAAAYSVRKLRSDYEGAAMRVRRSSDDAELDIFFDGADLDTAALLTFVGAGDGFVTTWYDQSGNNYHVSQSTLISQPIIVDNGIPVLESGIFAIAFDGTNDFLESVVTIDLSTGGSVFTVVSRWSSTGTLISLNSNSTTTDEFLLWNNFSSQSLRVDQKLPGGTGSGAITSRQLFTAISDNSVNSTYSNGIQTDSDIVAGIVPSTAIRLRLGARDAGNLLSNPILQQVVFYNSEKYSDRMAIETVINTSL